MLRWEMGIIKENGDFVVEPQFEGAKTFNKEGDCSCKRKWKMEADPA